MLRFDHPSAVLRVDDATRGLEASPKAFSRLGSMLTTSGENGLSASNEGATERVLVFTGSCFKTGVVRALEDFEDLVCSGDIVALDNRA